MRRFALVNVSTGERTEIKRELTIGRREGDLVVDDAKVSQAHAQIHVDAGELVLSDLESRNGSFVDERQISGSQFLLDGQTIRLGQTRWKVEITGELAAGATQVSGVSAGDETRISHGPKSPVGPEPVVQAQPQWEAAPSTRRVSAARSELATTVCYGIVIADAVALGIYFAAR